MEKKTVEKNTTEKETTKNKTTKSEASKKKSEKKKFTWKHTLALVVVLGLVVCLALGYYMSVASAYFLKGTTINGYDVSGKMPNEVVDMLLEGYSDREISIIENDTVVYNKKMSDLGYKVDEEKLEELIREQLEAQKDKILLQFLSSKANEVEIPFLSGAEKISEEMVEANLEGERFESQNAEMAFEDGVYVIHEEVYGNKIKEEELQELVKQQLEEKMYGTEDVEVQITSELYYEPEVKSDDTQLVYEMTSYNQYCQAVVTHTFGSEKEVLDWETIQGWLIMDGETVKLDEDAVAAYVDTLRSKYNTIYLTRKIKTSHGDTITLESNDYGYRINRASEIAQLIKDISANTTTEREPIYSHKGYRRDGRDDVVGCYIEIDLTNQHIWLYKDYKLIVESDIVTGDPSYQETHTGAFPIAYKKSPSVLSGATWNTEVTYWMPFYDGQGLHDATWRSSFGGDIYLTNGSHGCVNLPYSVAETIYNNVSAGYPIFLYK